MLSGHPFSRGTAFSVTLPRACSGAVWPRPVEQAALPHRSQLGVPAQKQAFQLDFCQMQKGFSEALLFSFFLLRL